MISNLFWIQFRPDRISGLIWIKNICKDNQQRINIATGRLRVINKICVFVVDSLDTNLEYLI